MANPFSDLAGSVGVSSFNLGGVLSSAKTIGMIVGAAIFVGICVFLWYYFKNKKDVGTQKEVVWWEETIRGLEPIRSDMAEEITIPGTNLKVFYIKKTNTWLPRFTRGINKNLFYVAVTENKEIVNFTLQTLTDDLKQAGIKYDHTDMRWAAENMREFIKRNYRDKATPWWREYKDIISIAVYIVITTASLGVIIYLLRGAIQDIGGLAAGIDNTVNKLIEVCRPNPSGVLQQ